MPSLIRLGGLTVDDSFPFLHFTMIREGKEEEKGQEKKEPRYLGPQQKKVPLTSHLTPKKPAKPETVQLQHQPNGSPPSVTAFQTAEESRPVGPSVAPRRVIGQSASAAPVSALFWLEPSIEAGLLGNEGKWMRQTCPKVANGRVSCQGYKAETTSKSVNASLPR